jgi:guanylate kinase
MLSKSERKNQLFVISAPSGAGKSTLANLLMADFPDLSFSISYTTRKPRPGEVNGREYHFISHEEFDLMAARGGFLEYAFVHGNYYGTAVAGVNAQLAKGDVLLDIDPQGAMQLRASLDSGVYVFILPPSLETLRERIVGRGNTDGMELRLSNAIKELDYIPNYDYLIVNDNLQQAYSELYAIYVASKLSTSLITDYRFLTE